MNIIDKQIGSKIRSRRIDLDLSEEQLAAALTVPLIQIMMWESGYNSIAGPYLFDIARILGVYPGFFFEDFKPPTIN
jgi:transcriptional regulator with XRE-family HTH domain